MQTRPFLHALAVSSALAFTALGADDSPDFVPLFNGKDLTGWVNANCAPETWSVRDGVIHCTGQPTGALRTDRHYENFILEAEWRHLSSGGNSGIFVWGTPIPAPGVPFLRGIEVQVLDNEFNIPGKNEWYTTHGDVFPIHGATMKPFGRHNGQRSFPSEQRSKTYPEWNHYRIVATNGVIRLSVNGKEVSGGEDCNYRKGYLALESEGGPVQFRNLRIRELPTSQPATDRIAPLDQGWTPLFTGLDLRGWKTNAATANRWKIAGERLTLAAGTPDPAAALWTTREFADVEFVVDCRVPKPEAGSATNAATVPVLRLRSSEAKAAEVRLESTRPGAYQRFTITVRGAQVVVLRDGQEIQRLVLPPEVPVRGALGLRDNGAAADFMNLFAREL